MIKKIKALIIKKKIEKQKKKFKLVVDYLVDCYYLNPQIEFTIDKISKKLKIKNNLIIEKFIFYLKQEKYIILKKKTNSFNLKYEGFVYLESIQRNNINYENNLISIVISIGAFFISSYSGIIYSKTVYEFIFSLILTAIVCWGIKIVIDKKYY